MRFAVVGALLLSLAGVLGAQSVETPVAFDSASRVLAITPAFRRAFEFGRAGLAGEDAGSIETLDSIRCRRRAASCSSSAPTIGCTRTISPHRIASADAEIAVDLAMATTGRPAAPVGVRGRRSPPGTSFARHIPFSRRFSTRPWLLRSAMDGTVAGAVYLLDRRAGHFSSRTSAAQYGQFARATGRSRRTLGLAAGAGGLVWRVRASGNGEKGVRAAALGSALVGTIGGVGLGHGLTEAEAHAAFVDRNGGGVDVGDCRLGSPSKSARHGRCRRRQRTNRVFARRAYPRVASYAVTAGDSMRCRPPLLGVMAGASLLYDGDHQSTRKVARVHLRRVSGRRPRWRPTAVRPYDLTQAPANIEDVGGHAAIVGGGSTLDPNRQSPRGIWRVPAIRGRDPARDRRG